jgi:hypothetical protein
MSAVRYLVRGRSRYAEYLSDGFWEIRESGKRIQCEYSAMAAAPYFFQILLSECKNKPAEITGRSIVVEVSPTIIPTGGLAGEKEQSERAFAEKAARHTATELLGGAERDIDLSDSIAQIGALPDDVDGLPPIFDSGGIRAWKL